MLRGLLAGSLVLIGAAFFLDGTVGAGDKKEEVTIKLVMKKAMKGGLCAKVAKGEASDDEKKELITLLTGMTKTTPPKGDADAWKKKTEALLEAAKGTDGAALKKAMDCGGCHGEFKKK